MNGRNNCMHKTSNTTRGYGGESAQGRHSTPTQGRIVCLTALGIDGDNGSTHDYTFAPTACSSRSEVINIADERSPHSPGFEA